MYVNKKALGSLLAGVVSLAFLAVGNVHAQSRGQTPGYLVDSEGSIVRSGTGECWHETSWAPDMATIVGCDGVVLDVKVEVVKGSPSGIVSLIVIPGAALFAFDSAELSQDGKKALEEYLARYRGKVRPELAKAYAGIVIGHTDSTGDPKYNLGLSERRAKAVRDYLVATGVPARKLRVLGRGQKAPVASNDTPEGRAQNRRVEIVVVGELRALDAMRFPSVALFPRRSAELTAAGKKLIEKNREDARDQLKRAVYIEVIGHTDDVGDDDYNLDLSEQRAEAVRDYLVRTGVDASKIVTVGAGEMMPIASNTTEEGRAENRRVEVLVLGRVRNRSQSLGAIR